MREILFKAKRLDSGEWVEGYYWTNLFNNHFIRIAQDKTGKFTIDDFEIDPNTLCQFTGLTDKDGNKIWENDIVDVSDCWWTVNDVTRHLVQWNETLTGFSPYVVYDSDRCIYYQSESSKVIGNKFDNFKLRRKQMTHERFKNLLEELDGTGAKTLAEKNARYSSPDDALQNFHEGAEIMGCTTAQACWGYMTKHLSALRKMIWSNDFSNREDVYEKCIDTINYIRFLWAISEEERNKAKQDSTTKEEATSTKTLTDCCNCKYVDVIEFDEPCKSCKGSKVLGTPEYNDAPNNFKKA